MYKSKRSTWALNQTKIRKNMEVESEKGGARWNRVWRTSHSPYGRHTSCVTDVMHPLRASRITNGLWRTPSPVLRPGHTIFPFTFSINVNQHWTEYKQQMKKHDQLECYSAIKTITSYAGSSMVQMHISLQFFKNNTS